MDDPDRFGTGSSGRSSSKAIIETVKGSHNFTIQGFSLAKGMGVGKFLMSEVFKVGGYDWQVYFYPDGKNPEDAAMYVSAFVALASQGTDVRALFELTLLDKSGKGKDKVHSHFHRALESGPYSLKSKGSMWGYKRFIRRVLLESSHYVKDDCLSIDCTVGVVTVRVEGPKPSRISVPSSNIGLSLKGLLESGIGYDIVFEVGEESFKAHKVVLAARSPVFRAQFFGLVGNSGMDKVIVEDIEPFIFKAMLLFIYSDQLPGVHDITDSTGICSPTNMVQHLLAAADRYNLDRLKLLCEAKLSEGVSVETVATTLGLAEQYNCVKLRDICLQFASIPLNLRGVMQSEGYRYLERNCPSLLCELLRACASANRNSGLPLKRKRSDSSIMGQNLGVS